MKPTVIILSARHEDRQAITQAALANGCRSVAVSSISDVLLRPSPSPPAIIFCDAELASSGGSLKALTAANGFRKTTLVLIVAPDMKRGLLRSLKPWVHDYLSTPVLCEAAAARIKNVLRMLQIEQALERAESSLAGWLSSVELSMIRFAPMVFDRLSAQDELAEKILEANNSGPAYLLFAVPDERQQVQCDLYAAASPRPRKIVAGLTIPESTVFLSIRSGNGLIRINRFGKGRCREEFQHAFPPELTLETGAVQNLAGSYQAGVYVIALNYGRRVSLEDAIFLRGLSLPGFFLRSVADEVRDVSDSFLVMTRALAMASDSQSDNGAHVFRMNEYAKAIASELSLQDRLTRALSYSAQLHDVGKIYIHPDLLEKPIRLTPREFDLIKKHPIFGARVLGDSPLLAVARNIALTHHECWDGSGYPQGLSGNAIPIEGAIVKIADVYDALRTMHSYKSSCTHQDACFMITDGSGDGFHEIRPSHFHPEVLKAFLKCTGKFEEIYSAH